MQNLCPTNVLAKVHATTRSMQMLMVVMGPTVGAWIIASGNRLTPFIVATCISVTLMIIAISVKLKITRADLNSGEIEETPNINR